MDHLEYAQLLLLIDYTVNEEAVMTPEMYATAISLLVKCGLPVPDSEGQEEPEESTESKLH